MNVIRKCLENKIHDLLLDAINKAHGLYFYGARAIWFSGKNMDLGVKTPEFQSQPSTNRVDLGSYVHSELGCSILSIREIAVTVQGFFKD